MQRVGLFLGRFKHLQPPHHQFKAALREVIFEQCGLEVPLEAMRVQGDTVYLRIKPIFKNTIYLKHQEILKALAPRLRRLI